MSISLLRAVAGVVLIAGAAIAVSAAEPAEGSHPCAAVADSAERLACYDVAFPPATGASTTAAANESERDAAQQEFGLSRTQLRARAPEGQRDAALDRIEATLANVIHRSSGGRVVTLDNGQVWLLPEVTSRGHLEKGDRVTIRRAALGTYLLVPPGRRGALRARRIQ
ncbi:hypothetical protein [Luteimonas salinilitoris]|uniref:Type IV pilus biogenesis protein PilP n=1 Tax=Luteimonas salinilitoris TaxID=3237697 RepID=A0ABV4HWS3_9GAMM